MCKNLKQLREFAGTGSLENMVDAASAVYEEALDSYRNGQLEKARKIAIDALEAIESRPDANHMKAEFYTALSDFNYLLGKQREALLCSYSAADYYGYADEVENEIKARANCGGLLLNLGAQAEAYEELLGVQQLAAKYNMQRQEAQSSLNIATVLQTRGEYEAAVRELQKAEGLFDKTDYAAGHSFCLNQMATIRREQNRYEEALALHRQSLEQCQKEELDWIRLMLAASFSKTLTDSGNPEEALVICREILEETSRDQNPDFRAQLLSGMSEALLEMGNSEEAIRAIDSAENLFNESQGGKDNRIELKKLRARALKQMGLAENALDLMEEYLADREELKKKDKRRELSEMRIATEVRIALQRDTIAAKNRELEKALKELKTLSGMLPICPSCKRIRDDDGYWQQIESYISQHSTTQFSHSLCQDCLLKLYPDISEQS